MGDTELRTYGRWAGNPKGNLEDVTRCIESVTRNERGAIAGQCGFKRGHGPDGLYCKQHATKYQTADLTWYRVSKYEFEIQPVKVIKASASFLTTAQGRISIDGQFEKHFATRQEALDYLKARLESMRSKLTAAEAAFEKLEAANEPQRSTLEDVDA